MNQGTSISQIGAADAESGMILHEDVTGSSGQVLLPAGASLTPRHIQLLLANGIDTLKIRSNPEYQEEAVRKPLTPSEIQTSLDDRFKDNDDNHPLIKELARICRARMEAKQE